MTTNLTPTDEQFLAFFKALADSTRLKIIGLLAHQPYTVEQLAAMLHLRPSTISHHLTRLAEAGLVSAHADSYYTVYQLESFALEGMARSLLSRQALSSVADQVDMGAYDRKVLHDYLTPEGQLKTIPAQRKKLEAVLRHIQRSFEPGKRYSERQVNEILGHFHPDTASLRRELVGYHLLTRQGGEYWIPREDQP